MVSSTRQIFGLSCAIEAETKREGDRAGVRPFQKTIFPSFILSFFAWQVARPIRPTTIGSEAAQEDILGQSSETAAAAAERADS